MDISKPLDIVKPLMKLNTLSNPITKEIFSKTALQKTLFASFIVQIISIPFYIYGLMIPLGVEDMVLTDILKMETFVQIVEGAFYLWYFMTFTASKDIAKFRYYDWLFTTPTMLISTVVYFEYKNMKELGMTKTKTLTLKSFLNDNWNEVREIVLYNLGMLIIGYLQEIGLLNIWLSTPIGFAFFAMSFRKIYTRYASRNLTENSTLYNTMLGIWALYGVAAVMPNITKNTMYNMLDIVAKNFYGFFLAYEIYKVRIEK